MSPTSTPGGALPGQRGRALLLVVGLGVLSALLYLLLFQFSERLTALAGEARQGAKLYALVPLGVAMLFSFVHGAFTAHFWDLLGLRAKQ